MTDEGYIKFNCVWTETELPVFVNEGDVKELIAVRNQVFDLGLIGYDEKEEVGFGNISLRIRDNEFLISGTQTGHHAVLQPEHLSYINDYDFKGNRLRCTGPAKASSESLTHAAIYEALNEIQAVIHVHSAGLWNTLIYKKATTGASVAYGTPEMAEEVMGLVKQKSGLENGLVVMAGHEGGLLFFGKSLKEALLGLKRASDELVGK